jgi:adenylate cyclase
VSAETGPLLDAALGLVESVEAEGESFPQLRAGVAKGEALARGGDWYGHPVNLASRVTSIARPGSVLATQQVRDVAEDDYRWSYAGRRRVKGIRGDVELHRVRVAEPDEDAD